MSNLNPILNIEFANTNLAALRLLKVNSNQYNFLFIVWQYQKTNGHINGWCEPMKMNNLFSKTGLKYHIGRMLGMSDAGTNKLFTTMIERGYLEDGVNKFRVTQNFLVFTKEVVFVEAATGEENTAKTHETPQNKPKKPTALKFTYEETPFLKSFNDFKEAAMCCRNLPQNCDFKAYFEKLGKYYTTENKAAYTLETWREKIKTWLERDRAKGNLLRLDTEGGLTNEQILKELETYGKIVFFPSETLKYPVYKEHTLTFLEFFEKAKKREILSDEVGQQRVIYANWVNQYVKQNRLGEFFKERKEGGNTPKQQKTAENTQNTEGVEVVKMEQKILDIASKKSVKNG